jgi:hypothetical protein
MYVGGGPALNFSQRSFEEEVSTATAQIDFSDLSLDVGFNFLLGLQSRDGFFVEMKTSAYSLPTSGSRFGYNF